MQIVPTLNFAGGCREAIHMYEKAFEGKITCLVSYRDANDPAWMPRLTEEQKDWIYHAELDFGVCYSNFLTLMYDTKEQVQHAYEIMKKGSTTIYPMEATTYSSCRVVFVDRFGIRWGIMTEGTDR